MCRLNKIYYLIYLLSLHICSQDLSNITIYNTGNSDLPYNKINCLEIDVEGRLWVGTESGLAVLDEDDNVWFNFSDTNTSGGIPSNSIKSLTNTPQQEMYIGTAQGVTKVNWSGMNLDWTNNLIWETNYAEECSPANNSLIKALLYTNTLWAGSLDGLCVEGLGEKGSWMTQNTQGDLLSNNITSIKYNSSNDMVGVGTMNGGLVTYDETFTTYYSSNSAILDNTILDLAFDQNNNIIVCTPQAGLGVLTWTGSWVWFNFTNSTIPTNSLKNVVVDNNNNLWISTLEDGLIHYKNNTFYHYTTNNSNIPDNKINCMIFDLNNNLWLGTDNNGLVKINNPILGNNTTQINHLKIYPNIVDRKLHVECIESSLLKIYNSNGKYIKTYKLNPGNNNISMYKYKSGLYILSVSSDKYRTTQKIVKY